MNDTHFIFKTWLKSYRENLSKCPDLTYYKWQQLVIRRICQAPTSRVAVCCDASDQSFIYGFCVADTLKTTDKNEPLCVHFCFVKYSYRNQGLMKMMLDAHGWYRGRPVHMSHWTRGAWDLHKRYHLVHNPFLLMQLGYAYDPEEKERHAADVQKNRLQKDDEFPFRAGPGV